MEKILKAEGKVSLSVKLETIYDYNGRILIYNEKEKKFMPENLMLELGLGMRKKLDK